VQAQPGRLRFPESQVTTRLGKGRERHGHGFPPPPRRGHRSRRFSAIVRRSRRGFNGQDRVACEAGSECGYFVRRGPSVCRWRPDRHSDELHLDSARQRKLAQAIAAKRSWRAATILDGDVLRRVDAEHASGVHAFDPGQARDVLGLQARRQGPQPLPTASQRLPSPADPGPRRERRLRAATRGARRDAQVPD
jgi:hypothetical protein